MHLEARDLSPLTNYLFVFLDEFEGIYYYNEDDWYDKLSSVMRVCIRYANLKTKTFPNNNPLLLLSPFSKWCDLKINTSKQIRIRILCNMKILANQSVNFSHVTTDENCKNSFIILKKPKLSYSFYLIIQI